MSSAKFQDLRAIQTTKMRHLEVPIRARAVMVIWTLAVKFFHVCHKTTIVAKVALRMQRLSSLI